jgi:uncharacterized protein involved in type VI secretion and phage assembly
MPAQQVSNAFKIEIEGNDLPAGLDLARAEVEDHLHLPDAFTLTFKDTARTALSTANIRIGAKVKISVVSDAAPAPQVLLDGEVTALEAEFHSGMSFTTVRGFDQSHRLFRGRVTASYLNMTYSDVATRVANRAKLDPGKIDSSSPTYPHISQANESDWSFLSRLASEIGFEVTVADKALNFGEPPAADSAPGDHDLTSDNPLALMPGSNLLYIRTAVSAAEQVKDVEVRGWDLRKKQTLKATAQAETNATSNGSSSADVAKVFPSPPLVSVGQLLVSDRDAEQAAKALGDLVAASHTELEGEARGNPKLKAGAAIRIAQMGDPFDGKYVLTNTRHYYDAEEGYVTWFTVSGRQERSTLSLTGGRTTPMGPIDGVVPALVDDVDDPDKLCRVRLRFPWMSDDYVSDWSRVLQAGAGNKRGFVVMPEVGDEVLVAFDQGDARRPFVLGGLYNDKDAPETGPGSLLDGTSKAINNRLFTSRKGHQLVFVDDDNSLSILLQTEDKKLKIRLDESNSKIVIESGGDLELNADGNITVKATGDLSLSGRSVKSEAQSQWSGKGAQVSLEGSGPTSVKGQPIQLN